MGFLTLFLSVSLGMFVSIAAGILLNFSWYERKLGLLSNASRSRATAIRYELDDDPTPHSDLFW